MPSDRAASVLVVDDEPDLRELLTDVLQADRLQVTATGSGREAIELARTARPDLIVTDLRLSDCDGVQVLDAVRDACGYVPAVVITGCGDPEEISAATRCRPVELMTKPLDIERLRTTIRTELNRAAVNRRSRRRTLRLRQLARENNKRRKEIDLKLRTTCADLTAAYKRLSGQLASQQLMLDYQTKMIRARTDDDVFRALFRLFVRRCGPVFGVAHVCNAEAELEIAGRFGVPQPDPFEFCRRLSEPIIQATLLHPAPALRDAGDTAEDFDPSIRKYLAGLTVLSLPLIPDPGQLIGLIMLYRKGEQPFEQRDLALAEAIGHPTAVAIRRND